MMKQNRRMRIYEVLVRVTVYPLLVLLVVMGILACGLGSILAFRVADTTESVTGARRFITPPRQLKILPGPKPIATGTPTTIPSPTFTLLPTQLPAPAAIAAVEPAPGAIPVVYSASGAIPAANPTFRAIPIISPSPTNPPPARPVSSPTATPTFTATPLPEYDFVVAEFFNSPTTNNFLMVYVAIVDSREIPIGDMKIVGTRRDQPAVYESTLSKWHYEGHSAPGEVIKTGNVKFEPPGGIETTSWVLHLEDSYGHRQSEDIPFDVDGSNKQWYYIKIKRKF